MTHQHAHRQPDSPTELRHPHHRGDIQGLRAVAVCAVVAYHAGVPQLTGGFVGVDLFFVLSGYLITELLIREKSRHGRISLSGFWARRARRILPASTLVLVATALATGWFMPVLQRGEIARDLLWSAAFSANWRFAQQQTDYLAQTRMPSPVLHYWSLGVEEQFYLVWPILLILCAFAAQRLWRSNTTISADNRLRFTVGFVAAFAIVVSLAFSLHETTANQPYAFFGTPSRAWQLAVGALLACATPLLGRLRQRTLTSFAIVGVGAFTWSIFALTEGGAGAAYPGSAALIPTLAGALLIAAGAAHRSTFVGRALSIGPLQRIGDLSYSLYLWHFPVLIIGATYLDPAGWLVRLVLVALAFALSWVSFTFMETPVRRIPLLARNSTLSLAMGAVLVVIASGAAIAAPQMAPGAPKTVLNGDGVQVTLKPALWDVKALSRERDPQTCVLSFDLITPDRCDFGNKASDTRVILLGDSHAGAIAPGFEAAAATMNWRFTLWAKLACNIADVTVYDDKRNRKFTECDEFRRAIMARTLAARPDLVILTSAVNNRKRVYDRKTDRLLNIEQSRGRIVRGLRSTVTQLTDAGIKVVVVVDAPRAGFDPPACLADTRDARKCRFVRSNIQQPEAAAVRGLENVALFRFDEMFCTDSECTPVLGDTLVYMDNNHITETYAISLAPRIVRELYK